MKSHKGVCSKESNKSCWFQLCSKTRLERLISVSCFLLESPKRLPPSAYPSLKTPAPPAPQWRRATKSRAQGPTQTKESGAPHQPWAGSRDLGKVLDVPVWPVRFCSSETCSTASPTTNYGPPAPNFADSTSCRATATSEKQTYPSVQFHSHITLLVVYITFKKVHQLPMIM